MNQDNSKYNVFIDNYNSNLNQFLNNISGNFFSRISVDKDAIVNGINDPFVSGKLAQVEDIKNNTSIDNINKLKLTGKILLDIAPFLLSVHNSAEIQRGGANIINSFFDVAKETEDQDLLKTAVDISKMRGQ
jgi:hypothetical protein